MANTIVSIEALRAFSQKLGDEKEQFYRLKSDMDDFLKNFLWEDSASRRFKKDYYEQLAVIEKELFPAMERYQQYLGEIVARTGKYSENTGNSDMQFVPLSTPFAAPSPTSSTSKPSSTFPKYDNLDYTDAFKDCDLNPDTWREKTETQKLAELQKLEKNIAKIQERDPHATVTKGDYKGESIAGIYSSGNNTFSINKYYLDPESLKTDVANKKRIWQALSRENKRLNEQYYDIDKQYKNILQSGNPVLIERARKARDQAWQAHWAAYQEASDAQNSYERLKNSDFSVFRAVETVAHEGRHDCQYKAITPGKSSVCNNNPDITIWQQEYAGDYAQKNTELAKCRDIYDNTGKITGQKPVTVDGKYQCDDRNNRYDNQIEVDSYAFAKWFRGYYEKKWIKPKRIMRQKI